MNLELPEVGAGIHQIVDVTGRDLELRLDRAIFVLVADGQDRGRQDAGHEDGDRQRKAPGDPGDLRGAGEHQGDGRAGRGRNPVAATSARASGVWRNCTKPATAGCAS